MKKFCLLLVISILLIVTLCACDLITNVTASDMEKFNTLLDVDYDGWTLSVSTTTGDVTLNNKFVVTKETEKTTIDYTLEKLNEISIEGNNEFKSTIRGSVTVVDGKIVSIDGEEANLDVEQLDEVSMVFKLNYFKNISLNSTTLSADVTNPSGFLGYEIDCHDMKLLAKYSDDFDYIKINYTNTDGSSVEIKYEFN